MHIDAAALKRTAVWVGGALALVGAVTAGVWQWRDAVYRDFSAADAALKSAQARYFAAVEAAEAADSYMRRYERLRERGLISEERRLNWIEELDRAARELALPRMPYRIEPQQAFRPADAAEVTAELRASAMNLEIDLVHEGQLVRLLDRLAQNTGRAFRVSRCSFQRMLTTGELKAGEPNVRAQCELLWWTLYPEEGA